MTRQCRAALLAVLLSASAVEARSLLPASPNAAARPATTQPDTTCAAFGTGFQRIPGSDTCVKLGGVLRAEMGVNTAGSSFIPNARR